ncbi:MAG TPA: ABC transporter ATP-binding protein [Candidatus Limnocylindria bacterium]|nr:ABC transporter ATP-binding protein [Candidatus Limnocylindria bacterium]
MRPAQNGLAGNTSIVPDKKWPVAGVGALQMLPDAGLAISTRDLTKVYRNPWTLQVVRGLEGLDLDVRRGEVLGYLGPNGAGKTTTLKLLTGLHKPTRGTAWLLGVPIHETASRRRIGFLPEQPYFYDYLNGIEYLEFAGCLSGLSGGDAHRQARHWLGRAGLGERPRLVLRKYSKGMLQRLGLAAALLHDPELLILDEPMSGLDPFGRRDVRELIQEQKERGVTVLFSSHILPDVEILCDRVAILLQGRLTRVATVGELVQGSRQRIEIRCTGAGTLEVPANLDGVVECRQRSHETVLTLSAEQRLGEVLEWLLRSRIQIRTVTPNRVTLEELFMATAEGAGSRSEAPSPARAGEPAERRTA